MRIGLYLFGFFGLSSLLLTGCGNKENSELSADKIYFF